MIDLLQVIAVYLLIASVFCLAVGAWSRKIEDKPSILLGDDPNE